MRTPSHPGPAPQQRRSSDFYDWQDSDNCCFLCEEPSYRPYYDATHFGFPFRFQQCQCGLIKQTPMPNEKFFEWFFNSDIFFSAKEQKSENIWGFYDYFKDEPSRLATSRRRFQRMKDIFQTGEKLRIIKIGPSTGTFIYVANEHGHDAIGCDVSSRFVEYGKKEYGITINHGRFEHFGYEDESFDVVLLFNVIENIPNLPEFLAAVERKLKPGGHFILNQVDIEDNLIARFQKERYFLFRPPICYIFSNSTMDQALEKYGFKIERRFRDIRFMTLEKILTLLGWRLPLRLFEILGIHRIPFPIYAYPSRIVIARKPS